MQHPNGKRTEIEQSLETLEALYFLTQGMNEAETEHLERLRWGFTYLLSAGHEKFLADIQNDIDALRNHYGALAPDDFYRRVFREASAADGKGLVYISKLRIVRDMFSRYENAIVRWPSIKLHSFVVFNPKSGFQNMMFEADGQLFHDAQFLLQKARQVQGAAKTQRELPTARHRTLHTLLRSLVTALFTFLEAYLNGIAFDCFQQYHDHLDLDAHDFLAEWNSVKGQRKFVKFEDKVFRYPRLIAKVTGHDELDLSGFRPAHRIVQDGKNIRDAITHPSSHFDPADRTQKKMTLLAGLRLPELEALYKDIGEYVEYVERGIGHDPKASTPWLYEDYGFTNAQAETL